MRTILITGLITAAMLLSSQNASAADDVPTMPQGMQNLARGRKVLFTPKPNAIKRGMSSRVMDTVLTNGKVTPKGKKLYDNPDAIAWRYAGRVSLAVDLGQNCDVRQVALRMGGFNQGTGWIELVASQDGAHWIKLREASRFTKQTPSFASLGAPDFFTSQPVHLLRFDDLNVTARWIGFRMTTYGPKSCLMDQLYVFGKPSTDSESRPSLQGPAAGFSVMHPQVYFNKPRVMLTTNIATPLPVGLAPAAHQAKRRSGGLLTLTLDIPKGVELLSGHIGPQAVSEAKTESLENGERRYRFELAETKYGSARGRLYLRASHWADGQKGVLRYRFGQGDWRTQTVELPFQAVTMPEAPRLKTIMSGLGWWRATDSVQWPDVLRAFRQIGFNTFSMMGYYIENLPDDSAPWQLLEKARHEGFYISNMDSTFRTITRRFGEQHPEVYHQFADGSTSHGEQLCWSYRGKYYQWEVDRFSNLLARIRPDFATQDIELFHHTPIDMDRRCTRCQAAFAASGLKTWDQWRASCGNQMWHDIIEGARQAIREKGYKPHFQTGTYHLRPGVVYDHIQDFDQLYPRYIDYSEPSFYNRYYAFGLEWIASHMQRNRKLLPKSDIMPWLTPGDAGTYPGDALKWAMLECYTNGARGIWFWSNRQWDAEDLLACNQVVRGIAPVEDVVVKGDLVGGAAQVIGPGHVSGMQHNGEMVLLVSDYAGKTDGMVKLKVTLPQACLVQDLLRNEAQVAKLSAGAQDLVVDLQGEQARLLHFKVGS